MEIWKPILGYETLYEVSNLGRVKSLKRKVERTTTKMSIKERILKPGINKGYYYVILRKDKKSKTLSVHKLVATAFIENPLNLPCLNHKDENPLNNRSTNLEWCTYSYNNQYNSLAVRRCKNVDYKKRTMNTDWEKRKQNTDFVKRTQNTDYKSIGLKLRKKIVQLNLDGSIVKVWDSVYDIVNFYNIKPERIRANCIGKCKVTLGYKWRYLNEKM